MVGRVVHHNGDTRRQLVNDGSEPRLKPLKLERHTNCFKLYYLKTQFRFYYMGNIAKYPMKIHEYANQICNGITEVSMH